MQTTNATIDPVAQLKCVERKVRKVLHLVLPSCVEMRSWPGEDSPQSPVLARQGVRSVSVRLGRSRNIR